MCFMFCFVIQLLSEPDKQDIVGQVILKFDLVNPGKAVVTQLIVLNSFISEFFYHQVHHFWE